MVPCGPKDKEGGMDPIFIVFFLMTVLTVVGILVNIFYRR